MKSKSTPPVNVARKMVRITLRLPDDVYLWLKAASQHTKKSMAAIVRSILVSAILCTMKGHPGVLKKGESLEYWEQRWQKDIIPGFDLRISKKNLIEPLPEKPTNKKPTRKKAAAKP